MRPHFPARLQDRRGRVTRWPLALLGIGMAAVPAARALDAGTQATAEAAVQRGIGYLRTTQQPDGAWSPRPGPAVTAMVLTVMLDQSVEPDDPAVARGLAYILARRRPDGGIHDQFLQNYNTAICLSALARLPAGPAVTEAIAAGQAFLRRLQWHDQADPGGTPIGRDHPFYGGAGYGRHGRPDLSNTQVMLQGLYDSGLSCDDPAFQRALVFITRCQGVASNDLLADRIVPDGGFIYATSLDADNAGEPESKAGAETVDEPGAGPVSRLRTYGSMTYAGFKSYAYAALKRDDHRVAAAWDWIRRNYTVTRNPGMPPGRAQEGYYYYLMTMARALDAWGERRVVAPDGTSHDWAADLAGALVERQRADGAWVNASSRWMETDTNLVTAYALIALGHAME